MKEPPRTTITLLAQIVNLIDRHAFQEIVNELEADKYSKGYTAWDQLIWMLLCQLGDCHSIRDISNILASLQGNLNHLKLSRPPSKSTIAYQNSKRNSDVFKRLYFKLRALLGQQQGIRGTLPCLHRKINLLDSSTITLPLNAFPWASYTSEKGAIKLHTLLSFEQQMPSSIRISTGKMPDCKAAHKMKIPAKSYVVADRGYEDFKLFEKWRKEDVRFVVRHKDAIEYVSLVEHDLPEDKDQHILKDETIAMRGCNSSEYGDILRRVVAYNEQHGYTVQLLTNDFELEAVQIAELYRIRWNIEAFFKQVKQTLYIKSFIGTSPNVVLSQVWTSMIAILLVKFLKLKAKAKWSLSNMVTLLRMSLLRHVDLWEWLAMAFRRPREPDGDGREGYLF